MDNILYNSSSWLVDSPPHPTNKPITHLNRNILVYLTKKKIRDHECFLAKNCVVSGGMTPPSTSMDDFNELKEAKISAAVEKIRSELTPMKEKTSCDISRIEDQVSSTMNPTLLYLKVKDNKVAQPDYNPACRIFCSTSFRRRGICLWCPTTRHASAYNSEKYLNFWYVLNQSCLKIYILKEKMILIHQIFTMNLNLWPELFHGFIEFN